MSKIKIFLLAFSVFFCACAPRYNLIKGEEPVRAYPVFLESWGTAAVFKAEFKTAVYQKAVILNITKKAENDFSIKIMGDYSAVLLNAEFKDGAFSYKYVLKEMFDKTAQSVFEDVARILLVKPSRYLGYSIEEDSAKVVFKSGKFREAYYFKPNFLYPYAMKQSKGLINKNVEYSEYEVFGESLLPKEVLFSEEKGRAEIKLTLLALRR